MRPLLLALSLTAASTVLAGGAGVDYPAGYRDWTHVKSLILESGHPLYDAFGGLHHIYANDKAMEGYRTGRFPDGSVIVFDLLEAKTGDNAIAEGPRKILGVMQRESGKFAQTGGWGFEGFPQGDPNRRAVGDQAKTACYACHAEQASKTELVFSVWRD